MIRLLQLVNNVNSKYIIIQIIVKKQCKNYLKEMRGGQREKKSYFFFQKIIGIIYLFISKNCQKMSLA